MDAEMVRDGLTLFYGIMITTAIFIHFEISLYIMNRVLYKEKRFSSLFGNFDFKEFLAFYLTLWPVLNFIACGFISYVFHSIF